MVRLFFDCSIAGVESTWLRPKLLLRLLLPLSCGRPRLRCWWLDGWTAIRFLQANDKRVLEATRTINHRMGYPPQKQQKLEPTLLPEGATKYVQVDGEKL